MSNPYYNGVQFPEIPASFRSTYANVCIIRDSADANWLLLGCSQKMWYDPSKGTPALNQNAGAMGYCYYVKSKDSWGSVYTGNYYWNYSTLLWSNYDVPSGSVSSATIAFKGSLPTVSMIHLINETNASCDNGVYELTVNMTGCTEGNLLLLAYAVRGSSNVITLSDGWTVLGGGNNASDSGSTYQQIFFAYKIVDKQSESVTISQTVGNRIYAVCSEYAGCKYAIMQNDLSNIGLSNYTVTATKDGAEDVVVYATSSAYFGSGRTQTVTPADIEKLEGDSSAERLACWFDGGYGAIDHTFQTYNSGEARDAILECVRLVSRVMGYASEGSAQYSLPKASHISNYASSIMQWSSEVPDATECHIYFRRNQGEWLECYSGESLPGIAPGEDISEDYMEVKIVLSSTDTSVTPKFSGLSLWIRDTSDKNAIVLTLNPGNKNSVQNAVGDITVSYDGSGTLIGEGGPVIAFEHSFTPEGLNPKNDPNDAEHIEVTGISTTPTLTRIFYSDYTSDSEHVAVADISVVSNLIHVDDI